MRQAVSFRFKRKQSDKTVVFIWRQFSNIRVVFFLNQPSYKQVHHNLFITQLFLFYIGVAFFFGKTLRRYFITTTLKYALKLILPDVKTVMTKQSKNLLSLKFVTNGVCKNLSKVRKKLQFSSHLISFHSIERFCIALNSRHDWVPSIWFK